MKITEQVTLKLELVRPSETSPVWSVSNPAVCTVKVTEGGYSVAVTAVGVGEAQVIARTNCDFGSGVREHLTRFDILVEAGDTEEVVDDEPEEPVNPYWNKKD